MSRHATFTALERDTYDLLVIGGGIVGTGVARDAARRGLRVALVDKTDLAAGTSSKSSKLVHGGLRYLREGDFGLVFEAVNERQLLLGVAPHLVQPLPFLFPVYKGDFPGLLALDMGLWAYEGLCLFRTPGRHRRQHTADTLALEPSIAAEGLKGSVTYFDGVTDDSRLTLENALDAQTHGAVIATYAEVTAFHFGDAGQVAGVVVSDGLDPTQGARVRAKVTINAAGPWMDRLLAMSTPDAPETARVVPSKGVHLVVDAARLPIKHAVVMAAPADKRVVFTLPTPRLSGAGVGRTVIGTTDTLYAGDRDRLGPDLSDVDYLLDCANHYFPGAKLGADDVLATWTGLRPLMAPKHSETNMSAISREHTLFIRPGLVSVAGGKLTTFRRIAAQLVDAALKQLGDVRTRPCDTATAPFPGADGITADEHGVRGPSLASLGAAFELVDPGVHGHLLGTYGSRIRALAPYLQTDGGSRRLDPELPFLAAEVDMAVSEEFALRLDDVLSRRLPLILWSRDQGLGLATTVADRMGDILGWSEGRRQDEVSHYRQTVALSRQFRSVGAQV